MRPVSVVSRSADDIQDRASSIASVVDDQHEPSCTTLFVLSVGHTLQGALPLIRSLQEESEGHQGKVLAPAGGNIRSFLGDVAMSLDALLGVIFHVIATGSDLSRRTTFFRLTIFFSRPCACYLVEHLSF